MASLSQTSGELIAQLRRPRPASFWLQAAACGVVAWTLLHGGAGYVPPQAPATPAHSAGTAGTSGTVLSLAPFVPADLGSNLGATGTLLLGRFRTFSAPFAQVGLPMQLASSPAFDGAQLALSTIDVIVSRHDTLDRIFRRLRLSLADLALLRGLPGVRASLDGLRPGERLHLTHKDGAIFGLERRLNEIETLKVSRAGDSLRAEVLEKPTQTRTRTLRGRIESSLFESLEAAGGHEQTAVQLADIFGWDIDFALDVQPGDTFAVTYQEIWADGAYVKDGPIEAAEFVNAGHTYRAVRYTDAEGQTSYYSPEGRSLRRAFLRTPVDFTRISSRFSSARLHPILNTVRAHRGIDYAAPTGTPVHAAGDGRVRFAGWRSGYGNVVEIEHPHGIVTVYGHLSAFARGTQVGHHVPQGTVIAYVGMTGLATGPHLHYEYRVNGVFRNPQSVSMTPAAPIDARFREDFLARTAALLFRLDPAPASALVSR